MERTEIIDFLKNRPAFEPEKPMGIVEEHSYSIISKPSFVAIAIDGGDFEEISKTEFMDTEQLCNDTQYYMNEQDFDSAMECIECALAVDGPQAEENKNWKVYYLAGIVALKQQIYDASVNLINRSLQLGCPENRKCYDVMAISSSILGRTNDAFNYYKLAIEQTPDDPEVWHNIGGFYWDNELFGDAVYSYTKALEKNIEYTPTYEELMNLSSELKNDDLSHEYAMAVNNGTIIGKDVLEKTKEWLSGLELENEGN